MSRTDLLNYLVEGSFERGQESNKGLALVTEEDMDENLNGNCKSSVTL